MPAEASLKIGALSLGLAHNVSLLKPVAAGQSVRWSDVAVDESSQAVKLRREMERLFAAAPEPALAR
jgi:predicted homoserine dehydrogenase-like protein